MKDYLRSIKDQMNTGLVIQQLPTGYGKTYEIAELIKEIAMDPNEHRKIIFLTTMNKNLPYDLISELYGKDQELFARHVLRIRANLDEVMEKILDMEIPEVFQSTNYENLCKAVSQYKNALKHYRKDKQYVEELRRNADKCEGTFRKELTQRLSREFSNKETRLNAIISNPQYHWIGELYPAVYTDVRQVLLMSISKFILKNSTIIEPSYDFLKASFLDGAIIFIDEFDAAKGVILSEIIRRSIEMKNDYVSLFRQLSHTFVPEHFSADLLRAANSVQGKNNIQSLLDEAREIERDYHLNLSYKVAETDVNRAQNFLLKDATFHTILQYGAKYVRTSFDEQNNRVDIHFEGKDQFYKERKDTDIVIFTMLRDISNYLQHFRYFLLSWADSYRLFINSTRQSMSGVQDELSLENAVTSILKRLELDRNQQEIIMGELCSSRVRVKPNEILPDISFYQRGLEVFAFDDADDHNDFTIIELTQIFDSPEKILLLLANKALVIGASATAQISTVVGNFDLSYLGEKLRDHYVPMDSGLEKKIGGELEKKWQAYADGRISINTKVLKRDGVFELEEACRGIFDNDDYAVATCNLIQAVGVSEYYQRRYCNLIKTMHDFMANEKLQSMLYLGMALPKNNNPEMDIELLRSLEALVIHDLDIKEKDGFLYVLNGEDFDEKKDSLLDRLAEGEKLYILSSYKTIGAGQNLQYEVKNKSDYIELLPCTNPSDKRHFTKDIDAIYLGEITHTTINTVTDEKISEESLLELLVQIEELYQKGELNFAQAEEMMKNAFLARRGGRVQNTLFNTKSVKMQITQAVLQAVGRLCRTHIKSPEIFLYIDEKLLNDISIGELSNRIIPPEIRALIDLKSKAGDMEDDTENHTLNIAEMVSSEGNWLIHRILSRGWDEYSMEKWRLIRNLALKYPTASKDMHESDELIKALYITSGKKISSYLYSQFTDFSDVVIDFAIDREAFLKSGRAKIKGESNDFSVSEVSEQDAKLDDILKYPGMKDYFIKNHFATSFEENDYIMSPVVFHNIYKGALGEVAGKYILESDRGIKLNEIENPSRFEFFDYELKPDVYVDFKNWKFTYTQDRQKILDEISRKMDTIGAKRAYIINIVSDQEYKPTTTVDGRIIEIPGLIDSNGKIIAGALDMIKREDYEQC